mmetsp:Transcript_36439/g.88681  ORF Transcript_36439/g.88681 Transcript_36439/m.88681 type:complete len:212 (+) Transcript_36439:331-966(+)
MRGGVDGGEGLNGGDSGGLGCGGEMGGGHGGGGHRGGRGGGGASGGHGGGRFGEGPSGGGRAGTGVAGGSSGGVNGGVEGGGYPLKHVRALELMAERLLPQIGLYVTPYLFNGSMLVPSHALYAPGTSLIPLSVFVSTMTETSNEVVQVRLAPVGCSRASQTPRPVLTASITTPLPEPPESPPEGTFHAASTPWLTSKRKGSGAGKTRSSK